VQESNFALHVQSRTRFLAPETPITERQQTCAFASDNNQNKPPTNRNSTTNALRLRKCCHTNYWRMTGHWTSFLYTY
jgi:hypothetical protein